MINKKKLKANYSGPLRLHWQWSVILALTLLILDGILLSQDQRLGLIAVAFTCVYFLLILWIYLRFRPEILREMVTFAASYGQVVQELVREMDMPIALLDPEGTVLWVNDRMSLLTEKGLDYRRNITSLFPQINSGSLPDTEWTRDYQVSYTSQEYRAHIQRINVEDMMKDTKIVEGEGDHNYVYLLYLFDETQLHQVMRENFEQQPVAGLVYIDNFDEVMERTDEVRQSLLSVLVERKVGKYFSTCNGLVKKLEKDKYLILLSRKDLEILANEDRFSILEGVKTINAGNDMTLTISAGFGACGETYPENYVFARSAIEMALGRGGDQVVIKNKDEMVFYGGKTQHNEKITRVKARVKAQALRDLIMTQDRVVTMGHTLTDMDSFGATIGVCRAATAAGKSAHIVLGEMNANIREWVGRFRESKEYAPDLFITHEQAIELVDANTAVIVVDTNRRSMVECEEILNQTKQIVVLDHHRQTTDTVENAALSYIEPSASSACEMVAEILQYFEENVRLRPLEADCIYAGIVIDTQSFVAKTGVRTFEAAAYLRRNGADTTRVRKALRDNMNSYLAKAEAVSNAKTYMEYYAISICHGEALEDPNVVGAQAANDLLNIVGVKASFVVTPYQGKIFISARSIDELNVQLVMERLGGGGHMNIAGAQLTDTTPEEAVTRIQVLLAQMTEAGEI